MNATDIQLWLTILGGGSVVGVMHLWVKVFSSRVKLQTDLRLLKLARESGIDTAAMETGIQRRIQGIYMPGKAGDTKKEKDGDGVVGNLFMAGMFLGLMLACIEAVMESIKISVDSGDFRSGEVVFVSLFVLLFSYGMYMALRDALRLMSANIASWRMAYLAKAQVGESDQNSSKE